MNKTKHDDINTHAVSPVLISNPAASAATKLLPRSEYIAGLGSAHVNADNIINQMVINTTIALAALLTGLTSLDSKVFSIINYYNDCSDAMVVMVVM
jgi:hypothetical protein